MSATAVIRPQRPTLSAVRSRRVIGGFFLIGLLYGLPAVLLPLWGAHLDSSGSRIYGNFLLPAAGLVLSVAPATMLMRKKNSQMVLVAGCALAAGSLLLLSRVIPPLGDAWRIPGLLLLGASIGTLLKGLIQASGPLYRHDPSSTVTLASIAFGFGLLAVAVFTNAAYYTYTVRSVLLLLAAVPALFGGVFLQTELAEPPQVTAVSLRALLAAAVAPGTLLLSLLLFFEMGNEFTILGWLPTYLIQRTGCSPRLALTLLALFAGTLLAGRLAAGWALKRVRHGRLLIGSILAAQVGCLLLLVTNNALGAVLGILLAAGGFALMIPMAAHKVRSRFETFRPGRIFSAAFGGLLGGLLLPATPPLFTGEPGPSGVMGLPAAGIFVSAILLVAVWLEFKIRGAEAETSPRT